MGVWIEIWSVAVYDGIQTGHSLRGSVDWNLLNYWNKLSLQWSLPSWECGLKFHLPQENLWSTEVTPFVGVWIEITFYYMWCSMYPRSLPSWECGLKYYWYIFWFFSLLGHSLRGSVDWNQLYSVQMFLSYRVTPFVGVWIEIIMEMTNYSMENWSLPSWECGLKSSWVPKLGGKGMVTPFVGVWIEILPESNI